mmetsp:Transcript_25402/g.55513  ORF Transcript_25402/g.55513 Transcript_25402/m.55513 type:complete len:227 (+) Transcript_25402:665-1345(+)
MRGQILTLKASAATGQLHTMFRSIALRFFRFVLLSSTPPSHHLACASSQHRRPLHPQRPSPLHRQSFFAPFFGKLIEALMTGFCKLHLAPQPALPLAGEPPLLWMPKGSRARKGLAHQSHSVCFPAGVAPASLPPLFQGQRPHHPLIQLSLSREETVPSMYKQWFLHTRRHRFRCQEASLCRHSYPCRPIEALHLATRQVHASTPPRSTIDWSTSPLRPMLWHRAS